VLFELVLLAKKGFFKLPGGVLKPGDDEVWKIILQDITFSLSSIWISKNMFKTLLETSESLFSSHKNQVFHEHFCFKKLDVDVPLYSFPQESFKQIFLHIFHVSYLADLISYFWGKINILVCMFKTAHFYILHWKTRILQETLQTERTKCSLIPYK
jgi:hypothetical protein